MSVDLVLNVIGCCAIAAAFLFFGLTLLLHYLWHDDPARHAKRDAEGW